MDNRDWINNLAEWMVEMQDLLPSTMFGRTTLEDIAYLEASVDEKIPYVHQNGNNYRVMKNNIYYGTYPTKEKAVKAKEFLIDNNWDKELLDIMMEMGEI